MRNLVIITPGFGGFPQSPSRHSVNTLRTDFLDVSSIKKLSTNRNTHGWVKLGSKVDIVGEGAQLLSLIVKMNGLKLTSFLGTKGSFTYYVNI